MGRRAEPTRLISAFRSRRSLPVVRGLVLLAFLPAFPILSVLPIDRPFPGGHALVRFVAAADFVVVRVDDVLAAHASCSSPQSLNRRNAPTPPIGASSDGSSMNRIFADVLR